MTQNKYANYCWQIDGVYPINIIIKCGDTTRSKLEFCRQAICAMRWQTNQIVHKNENPRQRVTKQKIKGVLIM